MKKLFVNICLILIVFVVFDYCIFCSQRKEYSVDLSYFENITKTLGNITKDINYLKQVSVRPVENENSNHHSIIITGCSFAYGTGLDDNQTFSHKLGELVKNPIYNKGIPSLGINHALFLLENNMLFKDVKAAPLCVLYLYGDFHNRRMFMPNIWFESTEILYKIKKINNKETLVRKENNFFNVGYSRFPLIYYMNEKLYNFLENQKFFQNQIKKMLLLHFITIKKLINEEYPNADFIVLEYDKAPLFREIENDLKRENIKIISFERDLKFVSSEKEIYFLPEGHPSAKVWEVVTPKLVKELKQQQINITEK